MSALKPLTLPEHIETARLALRRPVEADAMAIFSAYTQDPRVSRYMVWKPHTSMAETEMFIASCIAAWEEGYRLPYVLTEAGTSNAIGMLEARIQGLTVDLGYILAPDRKRPAWALWKRTYCMSTIADRARRRMVCT